jgi:hypothetical protein
MIISFTDNSTVLLNQQVLQDKIVVEPNKNEVDVRGN